MKRLLLVALVTVVTAPVLASDVGVSINVGQPGFYGRIDIGNYPQPPVVYPQPVIIQPAPAYVDAKPIYLRVPPGHQKDWHRYCNRYNACGRPVYFVRDDWYQREYVPRYHEEHREYGHNRNDEHLARDDREEGHGHGEGHAHGHGNGNGHNRDD